MRAPVWLVALGCLTGMLPGQSLPGTLPLEGREDLSALMVAGIDRMALRLIDESRSGRRPDRAKLAAMLGLSDVRLPPRAVTTTLREESGRIIERISIEVFPGLSAEGLRVLPRGKVKSCVVVLPDADATPESALGTLRLPAETEVVVLQLISRGTEHSAYPRYGIRTNLSHREWIYRQSFVQGRTPLGYEVQWTLATVDWLRQRHPENTVAVFGEGEGGLAALCAAALDERVSHAVVAGCFGPREEVWREPIDRNLSGLLRDFGSAEIAGLIYPRRLAVIPERYPVTNPPPNIAGARRIAAPGVLSAPTEEQVASEITRARASRPGDWLTLHAASAEPGETLATALGVAVVEGVPGLPADLERQGRLVGAVSRHAQSLLSEGETEREAVFWKKLPQADTAAYSAAIEGRREAFWRDVIGRLPDPDAPLEVRSRLVSETDKVRIHEVTLTVWRDVFAWGWLAVPKDLAPGERRPVVVCQHGLEGLPEHVFETDPKSRAFAPYQAFALRLAERGYVTFAPHNPYRGGDAFRTLQRKLQPLGLSLFSVINGQHQRILGWLGAQPFVDRGRIAFYGLSYGGKSAMRIPAALPGYCLSICSGDFNEWVRKVAATDMPMSYLYAPEYEIPEWNLGRTCNYAEMAALIAPRPFMVERGHRDGVGTDEWVSYEYARVRRLYARLGIPERTRIEYFDAGHMIHGEGTFEFLRAHLGR